MGEGLQQTAKSRKGATIKALLFLAFIIAAIWVLRFTPVKEFITPDRLSDLLNRSGFWAPLIFIGVYAVGVCLFVPGTLMTALGAALFGPYWGFLYAWIGAMIGASVAFWIGRTLGRGFVTSLIGDRLKKYDDRIERNGFATVLYLRLIYFPFTAMDFGMGLTKVKFRDYVAGTGLGILVGTFIFTFFIGTLREAWTGGRWEVLLSFRAFFSVGLFVFSLFIPRIIKKFRKEN